jgi:hypothetical protein
MANLGTTFAPEKRYAPSFGCWCHQTSAAYRYRSVLPACSPGANYEEALSIARGELLYYLEAYLTFNFADGESLVSSISAGSTITLSFKAWPLMLKRSPCPLLLGDGNTGHTRTWHVSDGYLEQDG